jgi:signal peptidase I
MEVPPTRKVRPVFAFLLGWLAPGLGYVYAGELRLALVIVGTIIGIWVIAAWSRLIVGSAFSLWGEAVVLLLVSVIALIHPVVIAIRNRQRPASRYNRWWFYIAWIFAAEGALYVLYMFRAPLLGYEQFHMPSAAMSPTMHEGDFFLADTWHYKIHPPIVGEIVVLERHEEPGAKFVKRIVGLSGDQIEAKDGVLYRNGTEVVEPYTHVPIDNHPYGRYFGPILVGSGEMFVLGDFRDNSLDSRQWGSLPITAIRGRAQYVWLGSDARSFKWDRVGASLNP